MLEHYKKKKKNPVKLSHILTFKMDSIIFFFPTFGLFRLLEEDHNIVFLFVSIFSHSVLMIINYFTSKYGVGSLQNLINNEARASRNGKL